MRARVWVWGRLQGPPFQFQPKLPEPPAQRPQPGTASTSHFQEAQAKHQTEAHPKQTALTRPPTTSPPHNCLKPEGPALPRPALARARRQPAAAAIPYSLNPTPSTPQVPPFFEALLPALHHHHHQTPKPIASEPSRPQGPRAQPLDAELFKPPPIRNPKSKNVPSHFYKPP